MALLPGLDDETVEWNIIPRIPWYARPKAMTLNKSWKFIILDKADAERSRALQKLHLNGLFVVIDEVVLFIDEHLNRIKFPKILDQHYCGAKITDIHCYACNGVIFVALHHDDLVEVHMMDVWAGNFTWTRTSSLFNCHGIVASGNDIYSTGLFFRSGGESCFLVDKLVPSVNGWCRVWENLIYDCRSIKDIFQGTPGKVFLNDYDSLRLYDLASLAFENAKIPLGIGCCTFTSVATFAAGRLVSVNKYSELLYWVEKEQRWKYSKIDLTRWFFEVTRLIGFGRQELVAIGYKSYHHHICLRGKISWTKAELLVEQCVDIPGYYTDIAVLASQQ